jgi:16S rRNA (guanine527-N7)-methyltransferase
MNDSLLQPGSAQYNLFQTRLHEAAKEIGIELSPAQAQAMVDYVVLLNKWNKTYNLTAIRKPAAMLERHIIDSIVIAPYVNDSPVLDVGTGPGLPGIPLAILNPKKQFFLLDSNIKKTRFITQAVIALGIQNVEVVHARIEEFPNRAQFPIVVSRAFTAANNFAKLCSPYLSKNGRLFAMKGTDSKDEVEELDADFKVAQTIKLNVPGCEAQRHLIIIEKTES